MGLACRGRHIARPLQTWVIFRYLWHFVNLLPVRRGYADMDEKISGNNLVSFANLRSFCNLTKHFNRFLTSIVSQAKSDEKCVKF